MTKAERAALAEMDTTPERIAERQEHISQLLNGSDKHPAWVAEAKAKTIALDTPEQEEFRKSTLGEQLKASVALMSGETINAVPQFPKYVETTGQIASETTQRKRRKDAGIPRQKAPAIAQQPGFLSALQVLRLRDLIDTRETRRIELETAKDHLANREGALDAADNELDDFLNELQGK